MTLDFQDNTFDVSKGVETGGGGGTTDHAQLTNLSYASSGHTGFLNTDLDNVSNTGKGVITNFAMPSATYDVITPLGSGAKYTAPADGYYFIDLSSSPSSSGGWSRLDWEDGLWLAQNVSMDNHNMAWVVPIRKGVKLQVSFSGGVQFNIMRFYYC